jgi:hypothetical protein
MSKSTLLVLALVPLLVAGRATADDDVPKKKPAPAAAADGAATEKAPPRTEEQLAELQKQILDGLGDAKPQVRAKAADAIVFTWPDSKAILDAALASDKADVRFEATCLLRRAELGDMKSRIRPRLSDADARVRTHAVRAARLLDWPEIEPDLVRLLNTDPSWLVLQETLRGLEDRGSAACLQSVFRGWNADHNDDHRPRFKRVLVKILKNDYGDDMDKWHAAIEQAETAWRAAKAAKPAKTAQPATPATPADTSK